MAFVADWERRRRAAGPWLLEQGGGVSALIRRLGSGAAIDTIEAPEPPEPPEPHVPHAPGWQRAVVLVASLAALGSAAGAAPRLVVCAAEKPRPPPSGLRPAARRGAAPFTPG